MLKDKEIQSNKVNKKGYKSAIDILTVSPPPKRVRLAGKERLHDCGREDLLRGNLHGEWLGRHQAPRHSEFGLLEAELLFQLLTIGVSSI